ncbi:PREDICTED: histone-lysine N-methyltransferase SUV420H1-A-like [Diuraphis noxia]|uniref:histone-lysine N-methyltransferase SUV420H1-A-like n=1 Tax=Diuraphis noxia TaxID=143948 RepID=UPI00076377A9|nr:PREDICTED: histone-lysine N-methyltransferase SUV420H1-A-like [Diuraphis noxia]
MPQNRPRSHILSWADDCATAEYIDKHLGFETHKTRAEQFELKTKREKDIFNDQRIMYEHSINDHRYKYAKNNNYKNKKNDVKIVATTNLDIGQQIKTLCGRTAVIRPEDIHEGINDFSIMRSSKNGRDMIFLGPAAYINHDCSPNTNWAHLGESLWCAKTTKLITTGQEITADYGNNFFGDGNEYLESMDEGNVPEDVAIAGAVKSPVQQDTEDTEDSIDTEDTEDTEDSDTDTDLRSMDDFYIIFLYYSRE